MSNIRLSSRSLKFLGYSDFALFSTPFELLNTIDLKIIPTPRTDIRLFLLFIARFYRAIVIPLFFGHSCILYSRPVAVKNQVPATKLRNHEKKFEEFLKIAYRVDWWGGGGRGMRTRTRLVSILRDWSLSYKFLTFHTNFCYH